MLVNITLRPNQACAVVQKADGTAIVSIPLEALRQAYCDQVALEVAQRAQKKGASVQ